MGRAPLRFEFEGQHSARRGDHRVAHRIVEDRLAVDILAIQHRADVYRPR